MQHDIKIYGESKSFAGHRGLTDYVVEADSIADAAIIAADKYRARYRGMRITRIESGGSRHVPGLGQDLTLKS